MHGSRAAGEDDPARAESAQSRERRGAGENFAIHTGLAHAPRNQLGDLRAEINNENTIMLHRRTIRSPGAGASVLRFKRAPIRRGGRSPAWVFTCAALRALRRNKRRRTVVRLGKFLVRPIRIPVKARQPFRSRAKHAGGLAAYCGAL